ncbi:1,4-beta-xylanase [bacterium]|nr:MAG: 1,4-beta-xylanase [bacterium]
MSANSTIEKTSMEMIPGGRWSRERAWAWYEAQPWIVGCNFIPSTAINQLEMFQARTFDEATIARELDFAASIGMNSVRTYLHDLLHREDPEGFLERVDRFLAIASERGIRPTLVFFDDCWNSDGDLGDQPEPSPGVHNSGWLQSPLRSHRGHAEFPRLCEYVAQTVARFAHDERVLMWDLYNEPGNSQHHDDSEELLRLVFEAARSANPDQPLTSGVWYDNYRLSAIQIELSDVVTFHNYSSSQHLLGHIYGLKSHGRPVICTEWMARTKHSTVEKCLPIFRRERVGCFNWGLVDGKTNTIHAWGKPLPDTEPKVWFHDLFRRDGTPYRESEIEAFRFATGISGENDLKFRRIERGGGLADNSFLARS